MSQTAIFWPMITLTGLIYIVYGLVFLRRMEAVKTGQASARDFKLPVNEPGASATVIRNLINLYELPVLFYAVCISLFVVHGVSFLVVVIAWLFVATRVVHTFVHVTSNSLRLRQPIFTIGYILNGVLWIMLALHLAIPAPV